MSRSDKRKRESPMSFFSFQDIISCTTGILILITLLLTLELVTRKPGPPAPPPDMDQLAAEVEAAQQRRDAIEENVRLGRERIAQLAGGAIITPNMLKNLGNRVQRLRDSESRSADRIEEAKHRRDELERELKIAQSQLDDATKDIDKLKQQLAEESKKTKVTLLGGKASGKKPLLVECASRAVTVGDVLPTHEIREVKHFEGAQAIRAFLTWAQGRPKDKEYFVLLVRPDAAGEFAVLAGTLKQGLGFDIGWDVWPPEKSLLAGPVKRER